MRHFLFSVFFLTQFACFGQIIENFDDGDFTGPFPLVWNGTDTNYTVNGNFELQLNDIGAATSYLYIEHQLPDLNNKEWRFWTDQNFSPSGNNYARFYLTADVQDLSNNPNGYYVQLGSPGSSDSITLNKRVAGNDSIIAWGPPGQIASASDFPITIRVVRDASGVWELSVDPAGGTNFASLGTGSEGTTPPFGIYSGMLNVYTASNDENFYYDDIYIGDEIVDAIPPSLLSATASTPTQIDALFDEPLDPTTAGNPSNYSLLSGLVITGATLDGTNQALVHLDVQPPGLTNGVIDSLTTNGIEDVEGNASTSQTTEVAYLVAEIPAVGDIVINEVMFDPSPTIGLPDYDYIEIHNRSNKIFNVENWRLGDELDTSWNNGGTISADWLLPNDYIILVTTAAVDSFPSGATAVGSMPAFNATGDEVVIWSDTGLELDRMSYTDDLLDDASISGGVSYELVNPFAPCTDESDWKLSAAAAGGTPGDQNSVFDTIPDTTNPEIDFLLASPNTLEIYYNEGMDSTFLQNAIFDIDPLLTIDTNYVPSAPTFTHTLVFNETLAGSLTYTIEIQNVADCWQNDTTLIGEFALPETASLGDLVINEILADPVSGGKDWIEIYNNSDKLIDLINYQIADFDEDTISNFKTIEEHILIGPDDYVVLGEDITQIAQHYASVVPDNLYEMDLPSYSNDSGTVYLIQNELLQVPVVMDRVAYNDDWHFRLLDNTDGVTLERIDPEQGSSDGNNWHSAAETAGFGTPGMVNSQFYPVIANGDFNYTNDIVSPDSDGYQDVLQINFTMVEEGYVGHFTVYDDRGRLISRVVESELLGSSGTFSWDGVKDDGTKASIGTYVGVFEAFQVNGGVVFTKRIPFVVAGKI